MNQILVAREQRANHIQKLMNQYPSKSVLILKMNVVGEDKNPTHFKFLYTFFNKQILKAFQNKVFDQGIIDSDDGNYHYYIIDEPGNIVKTRTIEIEDETTLGRLVDIDVYHKTSISRKDLSCEMRRCLICNDYAHVCARSKRHSLEELHQKMNEIIHTFLQNHITNITIKAIFGELDLYPKFGLVSIKDSGCHKDMDYETFFKSAFSIKKYITEYIQEGCKESFNPLDLQKIGLRAERRMFKATNNVNTHKGLIFLLGIFLPTLTNAIIKNETVAYLKESIKRTTEEIVKDYYSNIPRKEEKTHADEIYLNHGLKGVRGEALDGLELIFSIPNYDVHDDDTAYHNYLIHLMSELDDTTIIHRTNIDTLRTVQSEMKSVINNGGYKSNKEYIQELSNEYIKKNISPGGSADMLVVKIIYEELKELLK